jgi:hypothetical protein
VSRASRKGHQHRSFWSKITALFAQDQPLSNTDELKRLEEKQRSLRAASEQWLSVLRDMERQGQSNELSYERYYQAYLDTRRQEKEIDLLLFNLKQRQAG